MKSFFKAIGKAASDFSEDDCMSSGAALAYYTIFSLPPLLITAFLIATALNFSPQKVESVVADQLGIPTEAVSAAQAGGGEGGGGEDSGAKQPSGPSSGGAPAVPEIGHFGLLSRIVGIAVLLFSATGVFAQLQYALNKAWEVEPDPEQGGIMNFIWKRVLSLGMLAVIGFLLLVSLVLTTVIDEVLKIIQGDSPGALAQTLGVILNNLAALAVATLLFAAMYKILPDAEIRAKDVWVGAVVTAALFVIGKALIGWYLQYSQVGSSWGSAAASLVGALVWVYYSSLIVLFGAELTQVWARRYGEQIRPAEGAVRKVEEKRHVRASAGE